MTESFAFSTLDIIVFVLFIVSVVTLGIVMSRHEVDSESYFLAGRGLKWWLIGFSLIAAILGAVVSSLAAMLNAASTIFTMDLYRKYIHRGARDITLVRIGRICVGVFVVIGCLISPLLGHPRFGGVFT